MKYFNPLRPAATPGIQGYWRLALVGSGSLDTW